MGARIVFIGDDFTGASDSLATYARRGLRTRLLTRAVATDDTLDVLGIATDMRALSPDRAVETLRALWPMVVAQDPEIVHFKVCSTFDSAPDIGSIGRVAREIETMFRPSAFAIIGGQPSLGRYCMFGNLFARGPDDKVHRIDRHPVMARHPVTPMNEADLGRHLAAQGLDPDERVSMTELKDAPQVAERLRRGVVLADVAGMGDLACIRTALDLVAGRKLLVGASSVAEILGGEIADLPPAPRKARKGRILAFAGSRSSVTAKQVAAAKGFARLVLSPSLLDDPDGAARLIGAQPEDRNLLLHLDPDATYALSPAALADATAELVARAMAVAPVRALGLAGGDTSSRIVTRLGCDALDFHADLGQGACVCTGTFGNPALDGLPILLKGGQMGATDLFDTFAGRY